MNEKEYQDYALDGKYPRIPDEFADDHATDAFIAGCNAGYQNGYADGKFDEAVVQSNQYFDGFGDGYSKAWDDAEKALSQVFAHVAQQLWFMPDVSYNTRMAILDVMSKGGRDFGVALPPGLSDDEAVPNSD